MGRNNQGKRTFNLLDVTIFFFVLAGLSVFISMQLFWFMLGLAIVLLVICLIAAWDEFTAWWTTRK